MFLYYIFITLVSVWCWYRWTHRRLYSVAAKIPTLSQPPLPVIGQLYLVFADSNVFVETITDVLFRKGLSETVNTFCMWFPSPTLHFRAREDIQKILNSSTCMKKSDTVNLIKCFLGDGILTSSVETWKIKKRVYHSIFQMNNLKALMPTFNRNCHMLMSKLAGKIGQEPLDLLPLMLNTALASICNLVYGEEMEYDFESEEFKNLKHAVTRVLEIAIERQCIPWLRFHKIFHIIYKEEVQYLMGIFNTFYEMQLKEAQSKQTKHDSNGIGVGFDDLQTKNISESTFINYIKVFSYLQKEKPQILNENSFIHEFITFCCAGTDSTAATLSTGLVLLGYHQHVQDKLFGEIMSVVGGESDVTPEDLPELPYLDQVYKETLRWASTVPVVLRRTLKDLELSSCTVPAGSTIAASLSGLNNDPETFPDHRKFDPDRFLPENRLKCNIYDFLPFGVGSRRCIGQAYINILAKTVFVHSRGAKF